MEEALHQRATRRHDSNLRVVTITQSTKGSPGQRLEFLVASRDVPPPDGLAGRRVPPVEIAWKLTGDGQERFRKIDRPPLYAFFSTGVETGLSFVVQGPYRTTPSRDHVPQDDEWNRKCFAETGLLLGDALVQLRDEGILDTAAWRCLPVGLDPTEGLETEALEVLQLREMGAAEAATLGALPATTSPSSHWPLRKTSLRSFALNVSLRPGFWLSVRSRSPSRVRSPPPTRCPARRRRSP